MGYMQQISKEVFSSDGDGRVPQTLSTANNGDSVTNGIPAFDTREVTDLCLSVTVGGVSGGTPSVVVQVDTLDATGNWVPAVLKTSAITAAGTSAVHGGLNAGPGNYFVLGAKSRISWAVTGAGSLTGVKISLTGR